LEDAIRDRISSQLFMGLSFTDDIPDEIPLLAELASMRLILKRGYLIDATLADENREPGEDHDPDWTKKGKKIRYGHKVQMTVGGGNEIICNVDFTAGSPPQTDGDDLWG
jgi:IS5 family transposase